MTHLWAVAGAGLVAFLGNEAVARYRIGSEREVGSEPFVGLLHFGDLGERAGRDAAIGEPEPDVLEGLASA